MTYEHINPKNEEKRAEIIPGNTQQVTPKPLSYGVLHTWLVISTNWFTLTKLVLAFQALHPALVLKRDEIEL